MGGDAVNGNLAHVPRGNACDVRWNRVPLHRFMSGPPMPVRSRTLSAIFMACIILTHIRHSTRGLNVPVIATHSLPGSPRHAEKVKKVAKWPPQLPT